MPLHTKVTQMLGIEAPIVVGGLTGCGTVELAAAVSNAGALGVYTAHNAGSPEAARKEIRRLKTLTSKPFGCNLTILPTLGKPPPREEYIRVFLDEGVKIIETAGSNPAKFVKMIKEADPSVVCIHKCTSVPHAIKAQNVGVDIISLDGFECAGHPGEDDVGNMVLQAKGAKALKIPYICSGGIADGRQLAGALALGADGVNCGTRFCVTAEGNWPEAYKTRAVEADERSTLLVNRVLRNTARVFKNRVSEAVVAVEKEKGEDLDFVADLAPLMAGARGREAEKKGDAEDGIWSAGQSLGLIDDIPTCAVMVKRMVDQAEEIIAGRLQGILKPTSKL